MHYKQNNPQSLEVVDLHDKAMGSQMIPYNPSQVSLLNATQDQTPVRFYTSESVNLPRLFRILCEGLYSAELHARPPLFSLSGVFINFAVDVCTSMKIKEIDSSAEPLHFVRAKRIGTTPSSSRKNILEFVFFAWRREELTPNPEITQCKLLQLLPCRIPVTMLTITAPLLNVMSTIPFRL